MDFKVLDVSIDFYAVTMEEFNPCNADFKTGTVIKSAKNIIHTLVFKHNYRLKINNYFLIYSLILGYISRCLTKNEYSKSKNIF